MSKQIAIKGHNTRAKEVIQILQMLGGCKSGYEGYGEQFYYYINQFGNIEGSSKPYEFEKYIVFTLEEFEEKYPYKVGNKVIAYAEGCIAQFTIQDMRWNYKLNKVEYKICSSWLDASLIQSYKEETMEEKIDKALTPDLRGEDYYGRRFGYKIPNGYEFDCIKNNEIILKPKQSQYPKTYEECCKILGCKANHFYTDFSCDGLDVEISKYEDEVSDLLQNFRKLIYCRDAYWKIAGERMGLDKPWEPEWENDTSKYTICYKGYIWSCQSDSYNRILAFPTKEMRDVFYENFKELIEICKELL